MAAENEERRLNAYLDRVDRKNMYSKEAIQKAKILLKDFLREARADGMSTRDLTYKKKQYTKRIDTLIDLSREDIDCDNVAITIYPEPTSKQLIIQGEKTIKDTDKALKNAERITEDTLVIGNAITQSLHDHSTKMDNIADHLDNAEHDVKRSSKIIMDLTRDMLKNKYIMVVLFLVVGGVITIIVLKTIPILK